MRRIKCSLLFLTVALIVSAAACNRVDKGDSSEKIQITEPVKNIPKEDYDKPLSREWIKEKYSYTDEELDEDYVDELIASGEWSVGRIEEEADSPTAFHSILKSNKIKYNNAHKDEIDAANAEKEKVYSRAYLMEGTVLQDEIPDSAELKWVFCQKYFNINQGGDDNSPDGYSGFMIDFENKKAYKCQLYKEPEFPHDYRLGEEKDLTDVQRTLIYEWFDAAEPDKWDKAQNPDRDLWHMGMEYKDGTVVTYTLSEDDGKAPLSVLKTKLWNLIYSL